MAAWTGSTVTEVCTCPFGDSISVETRSSRIPDMIEHFTMLLRPFSVSKSAMKYTVVLEFSYIKNVYGCDVYNKHVVLSEGLRCPRYILKGDKMIRPPLFAFCPLNVLRNRIILMFKGARLDLYTPQPRSQSMSYFEIV